MNYVQISSAAWSPDGSLLAITTKKKQLCILDPRNPSSLVSCPSHESFRPAMVAWASDSHLVTTGSTRSSSRELFLYKYDSSSSSLQQTGKQILDVSPALLIPFVDIDTKILWAYARGERSCFAFEIDFENPRSAFTKLRSFDNTTLQSGFAFAPKTRSNVKEVEIVRSLRLTPGTVEVVSFTVPRMKVSLAVSSPLEIQSRADRFCALTDRVLPRRHFHPYSKSRETFDDFTRMARRKEYSTRDCRPTTCWNETSYVSFCFSSMIRLQLILCFSPNLVSQAPAPAKIVSTRSKVSVAQTLCFPTYD